MELQPFDITSAGIAYRRTGGDKPPIFLVHGLMGSSSTWAPVARRMAGKFDVIMPDARGHGDSTAPVDDFNYSLLAADLVDLMTELDVASPVLVGHSMGGMVTSLVASQLNQKLRGVVLVDPAFLDVEQQRDVYESDVLTQHLVAVARGRRHLLDDAISRHSNRPLDLLEAQVDARLQTHATAFDILRPPNPPYEQVVRAIAVPTLLVIGDKPVVSMQRAMKLMKVNAHLTVKEISRAGHGLPFDQPEELARVIEDFTDELPSRAR